MGEPLRVIVVDDHALFAQGLEVLFNTLPERVLDVVGWTDRGTMAIDLVRRHEPDLALVDIDMPPPGGLEVMREIKRHRPNLRVVALTGLAGHRGPLRALRYGADAYLPKTSEPDELLTPLRAVAEGWSVIPSDLARYLSEVADRVDNEVVERLEKDDVMLWRLLARGEATENIAETLAVSERTAKRQIASLLRRLKVSNRVAAAGLAGRLGLLDDDIHASED